MTRRIVDKLKDRGGVTILMALFAMLVASMVCIVILGAAVTSVKQAKSYQEQEQNTLALQSAGELVRSEIRKTGVLAFEQAETETGASYGSGSSTATSTLSDTLINLADQSLDSTNTSSAYICDLEITASAGSAEGGDSYSQTVSAGLVFGRKTNTAPNADNTPLSQCADAVGSQDCQLIVTLSTVDANGEPQYLYLKYSGCRREISEQKDNPNLLVATFTWGDGSFYLSEDVTSNA